MISIGDPVRAGLVWSFAHPGGNITGNTILGPDIGAKRIQLMKEVIPTVSRVAFLWNPNDASHEAYRQELRAAAPAFNVKLVFVEAGSADEFEGAFAAAMRELPWHQLGFGVERAPVGAMGKPAAASLSRPP
jgi:putative ABC transport system substrate-binding protein